ncbi:MAG: acyltransferase family protein [Aeromicrobium sp.]|uniref:acyltransferase family protein n=1 Tax=Aeromicrobium sp. TaxID=1871063 RepID=UPI0039E43B35
MSAAVAADPVDAPPTPSTGSHVAALDGLRGVAVLLVVVYHALPERLPGGFAGVDVFFVLSGFLITTLLLRERDETGRIALRRFWVRRLRRLVPAMAVMVMVTMALTVVVGRDTAAGLRSQVVGAVTWTSNWIQIHEGWSYSDSFLPPLFNHLWSLGIEEQFYLLWPLVFVALIGPFGRRRFVWAALAVAAGSVALMAAWYQSVDPTRAYMGLDSHAFGLLLGAALALSGVPHALSERPAGEEQARRLSFLGTAGLVVVVAFSLLVPWDSPRTFLGGLGLVNLATVGVILAAANPTPVASALSRAPLRWLGERSYGLYLWHWPLIVFAVRVADPEDVEVASCLAVVVALAAAALSYRFVETPMRGEGMRATLRRWGSVLRQSRRRRVVVARLAATFGCLTAVFAVAALLQAPGDSEIDRVLREGQSMTVSVADLEKVEGQPEEKTRTCEEVAVNAPLSAFGDSVTIAITPVLVERRPGTTSVAEVGWQYTDVAAALRQANAAGQLQPAVLIATGTNGVIDAADLEALVSKDLAGRQVGLVAPYVPGRSWTDQSLSAVYAVAEKYDHVHLVDWNALAASRPDLTISDRVHPTAVGHAVFADLIGTALATCEE